MIDLSEFDEDEAHAWALACAQEQGCTCEDEPEVSFENCEEHGVHLMHAHSPECALARAYLYAQRVENAPLN